MAVVHGRFDEAFDHVAAEFAAVLDADGGAGSAFAVFRDGRPVVELHGGHRDPDGEQPMTADTLMPVFSGTKGVVSTAIALLVERGAIDPDARVAEYWPEFAAAGKQDVLVRHVLSHAAGLPYPERRITPEQSLDNPGMAALLARQSPLWPVGERVAYHALTFGWLAAELVRRTDGREIAHFVRDEITTALGVDVWLGLPSSQWHRTGRCWRSPDYRVANRLDTAESRAHTEKVYGNPPSLVGDGTPWNTEGWWTGGVPGGGAMATAGGMAGVYAALVSGNLVSPSTLDRVHREESRGEDPGTGRPLVFGLGFEVQDPLGTYGPEPVAFGHSGAGGSLHGCWPHRGVAFSYVPCMMRPEEDDGRAQRLLTALHTCLG
ncbi:beta-lactamase family protein [Saccharopolyspora erythraea]|uniref:serine hydrolase domain-containing protein n=1 Tax=Saccharopolyspora erythraea TaxID=1836 RepID=UPI001BAC5D23|nr:serine hydrolase domain-containing protein [Saccharopolyspora erythraea]QUH00247.1 beta-lactamase family protein [Saccharopolyspora erythraea]